MPGVGTVGGASRNALILGQRPTSPKGERVTLPWAPLAYCGSHCWANCITTGSGRDLPSVARNSVSRGRVPALHNATATAQPGNTGVRHPRYGTPRDVTLRRPTGCTSWSDQLPRNLVPRDLNPLGDSPPR